MDAELWKVWIVLTVTVFQLLATFCILLCHVGTGALLHFSCQLVSCQLLSVGGTRGRLEGSSWDLSWAPAGSFQNHMIQRTHHPDRSCWLQSPACFGSSSPSLPTAPDVLTPTEAASLLWGGQSPSLEAPSSKLLGQLQWLETTSPQRPEFHLQEGLSKVLGSFFCCFLSGTYLCDLSVPLFAIPVFQPLFDQSPFLHSLC